jgi:hypothetical protein
MRSAAKALEGESVTAETWPRRASKDARVGESPEGSPEGPPEGPLVREEVEAEEAEEGGGGERGYFFSSKEIQKSMSGGFSIMETQW